MDLLLSIIFAVVAMIIIVFALFWLGVGFITLLNWIVITIIEWFDKRRTGR